MIAWKSGHCASLELALEHATRTLDHSNAFESTFEMERLEALSGAVESLQRKRRSTGAVRLLEHLAQAG